MRSIALLLVLLIGSVCRANTPATQPTACGDVYLLPFTPLGGDSHVDWIGKAVEQNLLTDLSRGKLHPLGADNALDTTPARTTAARAGATYLITGTYQNSDQMIRFNGQIIEVSTGNTVGAITATGADRDLFAMEDSLSEQAIHQLRQFPQFALNAGDSANAAANKPPRPVPPALQPPALQLVVQPPAVGQSSSYDGSALQSYVDANRTPSDDFSQQVQNSDYQNIYNYPENDTTFYGTYYGGYGIGGYGYGVYGIGSFYGTGLSRGEFGYERR
jgi:TolB-like protein